MSKKPINAEVRRKYASEPVEKMIRRLAKLVKKRGIIGEVLKRRYYEKPSEVRRKEKIRRAKVLEKLRKKEKEKTS